MGLVQATTGFATKHGDDELIIHQGDILDDGHAIVLRTPPEWWEPVPIRFAVVPEEATTKHKRTTKAADSDAAKH